MEKWIVVFIFVVAQVPPQLLLNGCTWVKARAKKIIKIPSWLLFLFSICSLLSRWRGGEGEIPQHHQAGGTFHNPQLQCCDSTHPFCILKQKILLIKNVTPSRGGKILLIICWTCKTKLIVVFIFEQPQLLQCTRGCDHLLMTMTMPQMMPHTFSDARGGPHPETKILFIIFPSPSGEGENTFYDFFAMQPQVDCCFYFWATQCKGSWHPAGWLL